MVATRRPQSALQWWIFVDLLKPAEVLTCSFSLPGGFRISLIWHIVGYLIVQIIRCVRMHVLMFVHVVVYRHCISIQVLIDLRISNTLLPMLCS